MQSDTPNHVAHNRLQRQYYEERRPAQNHRIAVTSSPYIDNHIDRVIFLAGLSQAESILDVGCGMGKYTIPLAERGFDVAGLELSPILLHNLQENAKGRAEIPLYEGDILRPDPALRGRFDRVVGFFVLHHLIDIPAAFAALATMLKPGGKIAILEPNPLCPLYYLQITFSPSMSWRAEKGILSLKPGQTRRALQHAGFTEVALHRFGIMPPFARNRAYGARLETAFEAMPLLEPCSAFQLICGTKPSI